MTLIKSAEFVKSSPSLSQCPTGDFPEFAFIGRSNVGKSSLINMLTERKKLAKTSARPGKTQLINHFLINDKWYLVDLPGFGWAQVSKQEKQKWKIMIDEYLQRSPRLLNAFVLIDSRHEPQPIDLDFIRLMGQRQIPFSIVFTKTDKQGATHTQRHVAHYKKVLKKEWADLPPIFLTSANTGEGRDEILNYIEEIAAPDN